MCALENNRLLFVVSLILSCAAMSAGAMAAMENAVALSWSEVAAVAAIVVPILISIFVSIGALFGRVGKLEGSMSFVKEQLKEIRDDIRAGRATTPGSPVRLTEIGEKIKSQVAPVFAKHSDELKSAVLRANPHNSYDIQQESVNVAMRIETRLSNDEKDAVKETAFNVGVPLDEVLTVIAILLRDELLKERGTPVLKRDNGAAKNSAAG